MSLKAKLRQQLLQQQRSKTPFEIQQVSAAITSRIVQNIDPASLRTAHMYTAVASRGEIDTIVLAEALRAAWPDVQITFGVPSPDAPFPDDVFDVIFIPMVGFDRDGFRLGMGGGWYDRWLSNQHHALKIGLAYAASRVGHMPHELHDIPMDIIVTETGVFEY